MKYYINALNDEVFEVKEMYDNKFSVTVTFLRYESSDITDILEVEKKDIFEFDEKVDAYKQLMKLKIDLLSGMHVIEYKDEIFELLNEKWINIIGTKLT